MQHITESCGLSDEQRKSIPEGTVPSGMDFLCQIILTKVSSCGSKQLGIIIAGNVLVQTVADTLGVSHLTDDSAVG